VTLHAEVDWDAWEGRLGVLVRIEDSEVVYRVNVSESSGAGSPG